MKTIGLPIACMIIAASFACAPVSATTGSQESTTAGDKKPSVNFSGIIVTNQGDGFFVNNVTVSGVYRGVVVYRLPSEEYLNIDENWLLIDPSAGGKDKTDHAAMDLAEIDTIEVPNPHAIWHYLKPEEQKKYNAETQQPSGREFIEIKVTKNDGNVFEYLIELSKKIKADTRKVLTQKEVDTVDKAKPADAKEIVNEIQAKLAKKARKTGKRKTPEESFFAYPSIKRLMIGDFIRRDDEEERSEKCPVCPPCKPCPRQHQEPVEEVEEMMDAEDIADQSEIENR